MNAAPTILTIAAMLLGDTGEPVGVGRHAMELFEPRSAKPVVWLRFDEAGPTTVRLATDAFHPSFGVRDGSGAVVVGETELQGDPVLTFEAGAGVSYPVFVHAVDRRLGPFDLHVVRGDEAGERERVRGLVRGVLRRARESEVAPDSVAGAQIESLVRRGHGARVESFVSSLVEAGLDPNSRSPLLIEAARAHRTRDEPQRAEELLELAMHFAGSPLQRAVVLGERAQLRLETDRLAEARECLHALERLDTVGLEVPILETRAQLAAEFGEAEEALRLRRAVLERTSRDEGVARAGALMNLGVALEEMEEWGEAWACYESALESMARGRGPPTDRARREVQTRVNLARLLRLRFDRVPESMAHSIVALGLAREHGLRDLEAIAWEGLGDSLRVLGATGAARAHSARALSIFRELGRAVREIYPLETLARIALAEGRLDDAAGHLGCAEQILDGEAVRRLAPREAAGVRSRFHRFGELAQDLAARTITCARDEAARRLAIEGGFLAAARWKGRSLLEGMRGDRVPEDDVTRALTATRHEGETIVEFAPGETRLYAYRLDAQGLEHFDLGDRAPMERRADVYFHGLSDRDRAMSLADVERVGGALFVDLLDPILRGALPRALTIVPSHALAALPFDALVVPRGTHASRFGDLEFLYESVDVTLEPSSPVLAHLRSVPRGPRGDRYLLIGDPVYGAELEIEDRSRPEHRLGRLDLTREEVEDLAKHVTRFDASLTPRERLALIDVSGRDQCLSVGRYDVLLGGAANVDRITGIEGEYAVAYFGGHALADAADPRRTGLLLSWDESHGGLLGLDRIAGLRWSADIVVLAACQTARGRLLRGEGIQSVANAFLRSGSRAVLASLWQIDDASTHVLVSKYHGLRYGEGRPLVEAWREARNALRARGASVVSSLEEELRRQGGVREGHPYLWAGFVIIGAP
ncbi:MAG: CHAT domain-containing protein [Planctomycetota bacterium JB042]